MDTARALPRAFPDARPGVFAGATIDNRTHVASRAAAAVLLFAVTMPALPGQRDEKLTTRSLAKWRGAILPSAEEMAWRKIPWRSELHTALVDGNSADKPILLWAMNGHPLGCV